ncbi:MAG: DUF3299 domain-containing protein [Pirellulales bacterium]
MSMQTAQMSDVSPDIEHADGYKVISKTAVLSLAFALLSVAAFIAPGLAFLPLVGFVFGVLALRAIRRYPDELTGKIPAILGTAASGLLLAGTIAFHTTVYLTEVPEGFERQSFYELQPDKEHPEMAIPPKALSLHGKRVFIKGYVHPGVAQMGPVDHFLLVPDMGTCCFGGQPKLTDMIEVKLTKGQTLAYSVRKRALAGTFQVDPTITAPDGSQGPCYRLVGEVLH